jgi:ribosome recycling factor
MNSEIKAFEEKMKSAIEHLERELAAVRAGRANPAVLDHIEVEYYGAPTPLAQVASVAVTEARILTITPWDRTLLKAITKAIQTSDIGINPIDDGTNLRLTFPAPTEERRKQLAKDIAKLGEETKVAIRNIRRDAMDKAKAMKKSGDLTEDDQKAMEEDVQKLTDKYIKLADKAIEEKQKEIMSV